MEFRIEEYKAKEETKEFWDRYFEYFYVHHKFHHPSDPLPNREAHIQRLRAYPAHSYLKGFVALTSEDKIVGRSWIWAPLETSPVGIGRDLLVTAPL